MTATRAYTRAARYYRDDLGKIVFSTILIGISTLAELAQPFPFAILLDCVLFGRSPTGRLEKWFVGFAPASKMSQVVILAGSILVLRIIQELITLWNGMYKIKIGFSGLLHVRRALYRKLQELSLSYYRARPQGDTIYRLGTDTNSFQAAFNIVQTIFVNLVKLALMSYIMLAMNWKLGLIAIALMPILFSTIRTYGQVILSTSSRASQIESELTTTIQRSVASITLVQAFGREADEYARFNDNVQSSHNAWAKMHIHTMIYWFIIGICFALGLSVIVAYGGRLVLSGELSPGYLAMFWALLQTQYYDPLYKLSGAGADMKRYMASLLRVYEVLDTPPTVSDAPNAIELPRQQRLLKLNAVCFAYRADAPVLREVSATIAAGEMVAFVGSSGVGKSSLLGLLPRFYDPTGGALTLDGHDLREIKLKSLRKHIALVIQEYAILPTTVFENIAYGRPGATLEHVRRAARIAGADAFIEALPDKYQTVLDESGQNLSGGQRQRISIARALASEAPILILDEPTSALDPTNERMITETLRDLKGQRTVILVSHRLSTVADCDRIYVMEGGRITEQGTHEELLALRGHYWEMAKHQLKLEDTPDVEVASQG